MKRRPIPIPALLLLVLLVAVRAAPCARAADEATQALADLKKVLRRGDAAEQVLALERVERAARVLSPSQRRSGAVTLRKALDEATDDGVKQAVIRAMARLGTSTGWVPVILASFDVRDLVIQAEARQAVLWGGGDYLDVVRRLVEEDEDPTFRARLLLLLGDRRRLDAVSVLLDALAQDHPRVQSAAAEALEALAREAFGFDRAAWSTWWETEGKARLVPEPPPHEGETVTTPQGRDVYPEPPPHVTRSLFLKLTTKDIVFVLDISGSVGSGGVARAKRKLIDAVEGLGSDVSIAALFFDEDVRMWKPEMVKATPENKAELALFLRAIEPGRKTDLFTPLNAGLQIVRRRVAEKEQAGEPIREAVTMIVVSDGVETHRQTPPAVVADKLDRLDPVHTVVHAVALGSKPSPLMMQLARRGGGHYVQAR